MVGEWKEKLHRCPIPPHSYRHGTAVLCTDSVRSWSDLKNNTSGLTQYLCVEGIADSVTKPCINNTIVVSVRLGTRDNVRIYKSL
jgi:hypothetical protein